MEDEGETVEETQSYGRIRGAEPVLQAILDEVTPVWTEMQQQTVEDGWEVHALWWGGLSDAAPRGPRVLLVKASDDASPDELAQGVTTGLLRRVVEPTLTAMTERFAASAKRRQLQFDMWQHPDVAKLCGSVPRSEGYDELLLSVYGRAQDAGVLDPQVELAAILGIPKGTLKSRLQAARRRARNRGEGVPAEPNYPRFKLVDGEMVPIPESVD